LNVTVAKPIVPAGEMALDPAAYGLTTPVTCGSLDTRASVSPTTLRIPGSDSLPVRA
jgi:hypothetical protein